MFCNTSWYLCSKKQKRYTQQKSIYYSDVTPEKMNISFKTGHKRVSLKYIK